MPTKYSKKAGQKVERAMHEMHEGKLRSGSGKKVTSRKQAIAIGLSEAREEGARVPKKKTAVKRVARKTAPKKKTIKKATAKKNTKKVAPKKVMKRAAAKKTAKKATPKKAVRKMAKKA